MKIIQINNQIIITNNTRFLIVQRLLEGCGFLSPLQHILLATNVKTPCIAAKSVRPCYVKNIVYVYVLSGKFWTMKMKLQDEDWLLLLFSISINLLFAHLKVKIAPSGCRVTVRCGGGAELHPAAVTGARSKMLLSLVAAQIPKKLHCLPSPPLSNNFY